MSPRPATAATAAAAAGGHALPEPEPEPDQAPRTTGSSLLLARCLELELGALVLAAAAALAVLCFGVVLLSVNTLRFAIYLELLRQSATPRDLVNAAGAVILVASIIWRDRQCLIPAQAACGWLAALELEAGPPDEPDEPED